MLLKSAHFHLKMVDKKHNKKYYVVVKEEKYENR